jgi:hypothetical protein
MTFFSRFVVLSIAGLCLHCAPHGMAQRSGLATVGYYHACLVQPAFESSTIVRPIFQRPVMQRGTMVTPTIAGAEFERSIVERPTFQGSVILRPLFADPCFGKAAESYRDAIKKASGALGMKFDGEGHIAQSPLLAEAIGLKENPALPLLPTPPTATMTIASCCGEATGVYQSLRSQRQAQR